MWLFHVGLIDAMFHENRYDSEVISLSQFSFFKLHYEAHRRDQADINALNLIDLNNQDTFRCTYRSMLREKIFHNSNLINNISNE